MFRVLLALVGGAFHVRHAARSGRQDGRTGSRRDSQYLELSRSLHSKRRIRESPFRSAYSPAEPDPARELWRHMADQAAIAYDREYEDERMNRIADALDDLAGRRKRG